MREAPRTAIKPVWDRPRLDSTGPTLRSRTIARRREAPVSEPQTSPTRLSMQGDPPLVSIVIPCLDEAGTIGHVVDVARAAINSADVAGEVVVVDNGSADASREEAAAHGARVVRESVRGYGSALRRGCDEALGRFIVIGDADESYDFSQIGPFLDELRGARISSWAHEHAGPSCPARCRGRIDTSATPCRLVSSEPTFPCGRVGRALRDARVYEGCVPFDGLTHNRDGVRLGDGDSGGNGKYDDP